MFFPQITQIFAGICHKQLSAGICVICGNVMRLIVGGLYDNPFHEEQSVHFVKLRLRKCRQNNPHGGR